MKLAKKGFTLIEIMIVVAIIAILAAVAIPNFVKYRNESQRSSCISNMKQIQTAGEQYLMATAKSTTAPALSELCGKTCYIKKTPKCPYDSTKDYSLTLGDANEIKVACPNVGSTDCARHILPSEET